MSDVPPWVAGGGDADGAEYAGALAQAVFRAMAAAADDTAALSSASAPELSSLLVVWALQARAPWLMCLAPPSPSLRETLCRCARVRGPAILPAQETERFALRVAFSMLAVS